MFRIFTASLSVLCLAIIAGCGPLSSQEGAVSGTISNAEGATIYLERFANKRLVKTDSAVVDAAGNFSMAPLPALELDYYRLLLSSGGSMMILTDSSESVNIVSDANDLEHSAEISGSSHSGKLGELKKSLAPYKATIKTGNEGLRDRTKSVEELGQIKSEVSEAKKQVKATTIAFIKKYPGSPATLSALAELSLKTDIGFYEKVLADTKEEFNHSFYYQVINQQTINAKKKANVAAQQPKARSTFQIGQEAPNIVMNDPNGQSMALADLRGKVVLLDFWASWCGPCRRENPHVVHSYNEYNDEGFEVFSVSLDRSVDPWKKAIAQDGLLWPYHVSDLKVWQSDAAALYGVRSIPYTMLLDREGKIIGTNLRGADLTNKLKEIFGH